MNAQINSIKACFLFCLDQETNERVDYILAETKNQHSKLVSSVVNEGSLPYHMTIIGGAKFAGSTAKDEIKKVVSVLKPFQDTRYLPKVKDVEIMEMNGNYLGIRLKFEKELPYIITGDRGMNVAIARRISPTFCFDSVRHVNVCRVSGSFKEMDIVKPSFRYHLNKSRGDLLEIKLIPQVWVKEEDVWKQFVV